MNARSCLVWMAIALLCGSALAAESPSSIRWAPDLVSAREASAKFKVPLLIHFYGDGCIPCRTLEQRVFSKPDIIGTLNKYFICVGINGSRQTQLAAELGVRSWPTDVFMSPEGRVLFQGVSPQDPQQYLGILESVAVMNRDLLLVAQADQQTAATEIVQRAIAPGSQAGSTATDVAGTLLAALPPPSSMTQSGSNSTNFYSAGDGSRATGPYPSAQLPSGDAYRPQVQTGPLSASQQPQSVTGSSPPTPPQNSFATSTGTAGLGAVPFPPLTGAESIQPPHALRTQEQRLQGYPELPDTSPIAPGAGAGTGDAENKVSGLLVSSNRPSTASGMPWLANSMSSSASSPDPESVSNPHFAEPAQSPAAAAPQASGLGTATGSLPPAVGDAGLTAPWLDGYCPVALQRQQWQPGQAQYAVQHRGRVYWTSSATAAEEFLRSPDRYAPVLSGCDPMILLSEGRLIPGSTQFGLFEAHRGQILLFSSARTKADFQQNFDTNMQAVQAISQRSMGQ